MIRLPRQQGISPGFKEGFGISAADPGHSGVTGPSLAQPAMASLPAHAPPSAAATRTKALTCPQCGGSGTLRMGDQQFRTCLDCLGQGQLPSAVQHELLFPSFSAAVSAVPAR